MLRKSVILPKEKAPTLRTCHTCLCESTMKLCPKCKTETLVPSSSVEYNQWIERLCEEALLLGDLLKAEKDLKNWKHLKQHLQELVYVITKELESHP